MYHSFKSHRERSPGRVFEKYYEADPSGMLFEVRFNLKYFLFMQAIKPLAKCMQSSVHSAVSKGDTQ